MTSASGASASFGRSPDELADETIRRVGRRIRARRTEVGMTLHQLAARTGVSTSMLSLVERGIAGASIGTLVAVASALGLQMSELFDPEGEPSVSPVVRKEQQIVVETVDGVLRRLIRSSPHEGVEMVVNEYAPGTASAEAPVHHQGHEYGIVIAGVLVVELDGEAHRLRTHDAISYSSAIPHRISNPGRQKARAIWFNLSH